MDIIDTLCINCQNFISLLNTDLHSKTCTSPETPHSSPTDQDELTLINLKLAKIKSSLDSFSPLPKHQQDIKNFLIRQSAEILSIKFLSLENLNLCLRINEGLKSYNKIKEEDTFLVIYLERIKICGKDKAKIMLEIIRKEPVEKVSFVFDNLDYGELSKIREENESEIEGFQISMIKSTEGVRSSLRISNECSFGSSFDDVEFDERQMSEEALRKYFYSKCLKQKIRKGKSFVQISSLYRVVKGKRIPPDKWDEFIQEQLFNNV